MNLEKACDKGNREALWQVLRIYDMGGKPSIGIKSMYANILIRTGVKNESERLRIDSGVRRGCVMSLWLFNVYMDAVMKKGKMGKGRMEQRYQEEGSGIA